MVILAAATLTLFAWFSHSFGDYDSWWHLKTGQYIVQQHRFPKPDPFAYTTYMGAPAYPEEPMVRDFNLTHEWLSQVVFYLAYSAAGFGGVVALRMILLYATCALVGWRIRQRTGNAYWAMAGGFATGIVLLNFAVERPHIITYALLAATLCILDRGRPLWALPPLFLVWANCHGGYILGLAALAVYCAEPVWRRTTDTRLWIVSACCVAATFLNPNGLRIFQVLLSYRSSELQKSLWEWAPTPYWQLSAYSVLLFAATACLLLSWKRVRLADAALFAIFAAASLLAIRNMFLVGLAAPLIVAVYFPVRLQASWLRPVPWLLAAASVFGAVAASASPASFHFRADEDAWPRGAADFLLAHRIQQRILNNYAIGGYLIWKLWPQQRVFVDGRALNEKAYMDGLRMELVDPADSKDPARPLRQYGIDAVVMTGFDYLGGDPYLLPLVLALNQGAEWKLVYADRVAFILMRNPPPGVQPIDPPKIFDALEDQCSFHMRSYPAESRCALGLMNTFQAFGDQARFEKWRAASQAQAR